MLNHSEIFFGMLSIQGKGISCAFQRIAFASESVTDIVGVNLGLFDGGPLGVAILDCRVDKLCHTLNIIATKLISWSQF